MIRYSFTNLVILISSVLLSCSSQKAEKNKLKSNETSFRNSYVQINRNNPCYFELSNGDPYIPIGLNLGGNDMDTVEYYLQKLSVNGGNFARFWLSRPLFEIEKVYGKYSEEKAGNIDKLLNLALKYNIKVKLCLESFRQIIPDRGSFNKPQYHVKNGGSFNNMDEYINTEAGRKAYLNKVEFFRARYGDHPVVFGWELWNEMNGIMCKGLWDWNKYMLPEVHKKFPGNLVMQSLGSFDSEDRRPDYQFISSLQSNDVAQIHRYINSGSKWGKLDVLLAPMDVLTADAINEVRSYNLSKPLLMAEVGAVLPDYEGPSELYPLDKEGMLLHDMLFAPFFSGSAGSGHPWYWDYYIDKNNLWYHFGRFSESVKGINPAEEGFMPLLIYHKRFRIYVLVGKNTILAWVRDIKNTWKSELVKGEKPEEISQEKIDFTNLIPSSLTKKVRIYNPWTNVWLDAGNKGDVDLPPFKRSLVIKIEKKN